MADTITFTPLPTAGAPTPAAVTFTPVNNMTVVVGTLRRALDSVIIDRADLSYIRDRGITTKEVTVVGTDTFSSQANAAAQLLKLEQMQGASCTITSAQFSTISNAICTDNGGPQIQACQSPGFFINYRLTFQVTST
jgi:hypothetical protein